MLQREDLDVQLGHGVPDLMVGVGNLETVEDDQNMAASENNEPPMVGMTFNTMDDAVGYYQKYAMQEGFSVTKAAGVKGPTGERRYQTLRCHRGGKLRAKGDGSLMPRPTYKIGCDARMLLALGKDTRWRVTKVVLEHSHVLSPSKSRFIAQHRVIPPHVKRRLQDNDLAGIRPCSSFRAIVQEAGGYEKVSCTSSDVRNYIKKTRNLRLGEGDAQAIHGMFVRMQERSRDFFYAIDPDEEGRLRNVFWADARSRAAYEEFGDVVTFDTTYLVNRYNMPFAPFIGINHHGHSTLFGCALISNEEERTFEWVFRTWLRCMRNQHPKGIITDQCRSMANAIASTMPGTQHRYCLWHIMRKIPEKLGSHHLYDELKDCLLETVYDSLTTDDFDRRWEGLLARFNLESNEWLRSIYEVRSKWIPAFVRVTFWAGMSSTQRSESMNAYFDGYVQSRTTLKQFVEQYEVALKGKIEKENIADFQSSTSVVPCATSFVAEKQFQRAYTNEMFKLAQREVTSVMYCESELVSEAGHLAEYKVMEITGPSHKQCWKETRVLYNTCNKDCSCLCHMFEFRGILCRHALRVIIKRDGGVVPDKYILRRWRKDELRCHSKVAVTSAIVDGSPEMRRARQMEHDLHDVVEMASKSDDILHYAQAQVKILKSTMSTWETSCHRGLEAEERSADEESGGDDAHLEGLSLLEPRVCKSRGRPKSRRLKSSVEHHTSRKRRRTKNTDATTQVNNLHGCSVIPNMVLPSDVSMHTASFASLISSQESAARMVNGVQSPLPQVMQALSVQFQAMQGLSPVIGTTQNSVVAGNSSICSGDPVTRS